MKLDEIARLAGVSRTTASYVINGKAKQYRVSDKTVEKVMVVVREYNFQPNAVAAGLRAGKTHSIGLVIPDLENTSYTRIANHLERLARQKGYQLLIACSEDQPENEMRCVQHLLQRKVDALIVSTSLPQESSFYLSKTKIGIPIIALDRALNPQCFTSIVGADIEDAEVLAKALSANPVKSILFISALPNLSVSNLREQGFRNVLSDSAYQLDFLYANSYDKEAIEKDFSQWLMHNKLPDALFITSFSLLQGVLNEVIKQKGFLPKELIIAAFGDNELLDFLDCQVLCMAQKHKDIAVLLLSSLLDSLGQNSERSLGIRKVKRVLIHRGSTKRL